MPGASQPGASRLSANISPLLVRPEDAQQLRRQPPPPRAQDGAQAVGPREPDVEYLEDSKISVDYFRMKGSVYFSVIAKGEKEEQPPKAPSLEKHNSRERDENVKFFNISSADGEQMILNSLVVPAADQVDQGPGRKGLKRDPVKRLSKAEQDMFNFSKKCLICMENKVDCIYSPCNHGGVCFECAKINLIRKNSCYYCREVAASHQNVFKVYQVQPSAENKKFFRVVKAYFIYDKREEKLYQEFASDSNLEEHIQGDSPDARASQQQAQDLSAGSLHNQNSLPTLNPRLSHSQAFVPEADRGSGEPSESAPGPPQDPARDSAYRRRMDSFELAGLVVPPMGPSPRLEQPLAPRAVGSDPHSLEEPASPQVPVSPLLPFPRHGSDSLLPPLQDPGFRRRVGSHDGLQTQAQRSPGLNRIEEVEENYD